MNRYLHARSVFFEHGGSSSADKTIGVTVLKMIGSPQRALFACLTIAMAALSVLLITAPADAQVNVTTFHNDNARTGQNTLETTLTPQTVNSGGFGKLFTAAVDGYVHAQPLYMSQVSIAGGQHNVLYVATEHDSLYAIDADTGMQYWQISLIPAGGRTVIGDTDIGAGCDDIIPEIGITGTPVIDPTTNTLYVVARAIVHGKAVQQLHAIDIGTSLEKFGAPIAIQASVAGTGYDAKNSVVSFNALQENQRAALLLENGHVVIAWGSNCDFDPWHGWVMSYSAATLAQEAVFNSTPNGQEGGIWMGSGGIAADTSGNLYLATGNGDWDGVTEFSDSILKLGPPANGGFPVADFFTPYNQAYLGGNDIDVASSSPVLLPTLTGGGAGSGTTNANSGQLLAHMGKSGTIFLLDRNNLGRYCVTQTAGCTASDPQIVQEIPHATTGVWGAPAYWNGNIYWAGQNDALNAFSFNVGTGAISTAPTSISPQVFGYPAPMPSISANGTSNGILWALEADTYGATCKNGSNCQTLYAYDATNLANVLYSSNQAPNFRDVPGSAVKFATPTITNGKVYVGSQYAVSAYGMLGTSTNPGSTVATPALSPSPGSYHSIQTVVIGDATPGAVIYYTTDGTPPTTSSAVYSAPLLVNSTSTIQAIATAPNLTNSAVASGTYTLTPIGVSPAEAANIVGIVTDGSPVANGGLDTFGDALSGVLLGTSLTWSGQTFALGTSGTTNATSNTTIPIPAGSYGSVSLLALGVNGNQRNQTFTVNYTDGTSSVFTQSVSDWYSPSSNPGESIAIKMPYRVTQNGSLDSVSGPVYLYGYTFAVNSAKFVASLTLPANRNVVVFAVNASPNIIAAPIVAAPSFTPSPGVFSSAQTVTISDATTGAQIFYTTDGSQPTAASNAYSTPLPITGATTLSAIAIEPGYTNSPTTVGVYTINLPQTTPVPSLNPAPGSYAGPVSVTLADANAGASIYYTTDGSIPTVNSTLYTAPFAVNASTPIQAVAIANGQASAVGTGVYTIAGASNTTPVSLSLAANANVVATDTDGTPVPGGGLDTFGDAYSALLTGTSASFVGQAFTFGPPGTLNALSNTVLPLPSGNFATLSFLGTGLNGNQTAQSFVVTYTDGTSTTFTQSLSDWFAPASNAGESTVLTMAYRLTQSGALDKASGTVFIYGYSFALNPAKTVASLTLPANRNVVILAVDLSSSAAATVAMPTFSPAPSVYTSAQTVSLADATQGASIYYTTNGSTPTSSSTPYSTSIAVSTTTTIEAIAITSSGSSAVSVGTFTIQPGGSFTLSPATAGLTIVDGQSATDSVAVTPQNGFTGTVNFAVGGLPNGATAVFSPTSSATGTTLSLAVASTTVPGIYPLTVTGTSGSVTAAASVTLTVAAPPSFTLASGLSSLSITQGQIGTDGVTVTALHGFTGAVTFSVSGLPNGTNSGFAPASSSSFSLLGILVGSTTTPGSYPLTITGTSGGLTASASLTLVVSAAPSFSLGAAATSLNLAQGASGTDAISVTGSNGFTGSVGFSVSGLPTGITATFAPTSSASGTTLSLAVASTAAAGTYPLTITGISGNLSTTVKVSLAISAAQVFSLSAGASTLIVAQGQTGSDSINVVAPASLSAAVSFSVTGLPSGATATFTPPSSSSGTSLSIAVPTSATIKTYSLVVSGTSGTATASVGVTLNVTAAPSFKLESASNSVPIAKGGSGTDVINVNPFNGFSGTVNFGVSGLPTGATATFTPTASGTSLGIAVASTTTAGNYNLTVTGTSGSTTATALITLQVTGSPAFAISAGGSTLTIPQGQSGSQPIAVETINGFSGSLSFSVSGLPTGATAIFTPASSNSGSSLTIAVASTTSIGTYTLSIKGTSGTTSVTANLSLVVTGPAPFTLSSSTSSLSAVQGQSATDAISVTALNGFTGSVSFSVSGLPAGATATFSPTTSTSGTTLSIAIAATAATGTYPLTIAGTSGSITSTTTVSLVVTAAPTFNLSAGSSSVSIVQGQSGTDAISVAALNGFTGTVSFAVSGLPVGATATFTPTTSTSGTSLGIAVASTALSGTYPLTITGTSGSITSSANVSLVVTAAPTFTLSAATTPLTLKQNSGLTDAITVTNGTGFTGTVTLFVSGAPTGVGATFSGNSLILFVPLATPIGTYPLTITGTSGSSTATLSLPLVVTGASTFTLTPAAPSLTVAPGASATDAVSIVPINGFASSVAFTVTGLPTGATAAFSPVSSTTGSTLSVSAASTTATGTYPLTVTGSVAGTGSSNAFTVTAPISLIVSTSTLLPQTITFGSIPTQTVGKPLTLAATASSGLAVTYTSSTPSVCTVAASTVTLSVPGTCTIVAAQAGNGVYAAAPSVQQSFTVTSASTGGVTEVNLASIYNRVAIAAVGTTGVAGVDSTGYSFGAALLNTSVTWNGETFLIGAANVPDSITSTTISLPGGNYSSLSFLAGSGYGPNLNQQFVVTYTDGTTTTLTQSLTDWGANSSLYPGEANALTMAYRITPSGTTQNGPWYLRGYTITLNGAKTVKSLTLPNNAHVVVFAVDLTASAALQSQTISFGAIPTQTVGTPLTLGATASSGLAVSFTATPANVCTVSGATATFVGAGSCAITASQPGNAAYAAATSVTQTFTVATPTAIVPYVFANGVWTLEAGATVVAGTPVNLGPQPLTGGTWSWTGPNGFTSPLREIDNIPLTVGTNVYVATYTNPAGAKSTATFTITVTTSNFFLTAGSGSVTVTPPVCFIICLGGFPVTDFINLNPTGGFSGPVNFSISGLPSGVTASFSPTSVTTSGHTTLTLTPHQGAATGQTATLTIMGSSGTGIASTVTIKLSY